MRSPLRRWLLRPLLGTLFAAFGAAFVLAAPSVETGAAPAHEAATTPDDEAANASAGVVLRDGHMRLGQAPRADEPTPAEPGHIALRNGPVLAVEEDPKVEITDVVRSVSATAVQTIPWLRIGNLSRRTPDRRRVGGDSAQEIADRLRLESVERGARDGSAGNSPPERGGRTADAVDPWEEARAMLFEVLGNPLTWVFVVLLVIGVLSVSLVRGRIGH